MTEIEDLRRLFALAVLDARKLDPDFSCWMDFDTLELLTKYGKLPRGQCHECGRNAPLADNPLCPGNEHWRQCAWGCY